MTADEINNVFHSLALDTDQKRREMRFEFSLLEIRNSVRAFTTDSTLGSTLADGGSGIAYAERDTERNRDRR